MDYTVDMSCVMKVNRNCELCRQKVTEVMHCVNVVYSVDFVGADNSIKLKARANPNIILAVIERYGEHGKISNLRFDGEVMNFQGNGYYGQSGLYLPSNSAGYYPPPPHVFAGNYGYPPTSNPPHQIESAPRRINNQLLEPPRPPAKPLHSYSYVEPPYWQTSSSSGGRCVIM
ncbi:unnamed protein product [Arabis nemorensis]|uniref:HMA domain-containing protein n=1 Tax=Arabis nemorensis TaxID=586526 RepID=A0A565B970_9BRAS|nr:unnamed protein product [Arabis nemorensis]